MSFEYNIKLIVLGEGFVGKGKLLQRYFKKNFTEKSTVNPAFYEKTENYNGKNYFIKFWDTAGQEKYNSLNSIYYQNALGVLIVYDVSIPETFNKVKDWVGTLREIVGENIIVVIAGNKFDLYDKKLLGKSEEIINDYCQKEKCEHFYTSAKTGYNVDDTFNCLIKKVLNKVDENPCIFNKPNISRKKKGRKLEIRTNRKRRNCC